jgi:hypothetical protein
MLPLEHHSSQFSSFVPYSPKGVTQLTEEHVIEEALGVYFLSYCL